MTAAANEFVAPPEVSALRAFADALRRETLVLAGEPQLTWQQLFNRHKNRLGEAETLEWLGAVYSQLGLAADAQEHFEAAAAIRRTLEEGVD